jgi:hypothetical protein
MHAGQATDSSSITPSYVSGGSTTPLLGMTIGDCFDATVRANPDRLALVVRSQGIRWTYRELAAVVDRFASGLASLGLVAGERVGIWSPNNAEWVETHPNTDQPFNFRRRWTAGLVGVCSPKAKVTRSNRIGRATPIELLALCKAPTPRRPPSLARGSCCAWRRLAEP